MFLLVGADGGFYAVERRENGDHRMLDRLELRERRCRMADPELECSEHPSGGVIDQSDRLGRGEHAGPFDVGEADVVAALPGGDEREPHECVRLELDLRGVLGEPYGLLRHRVRLRPAAGDDLREREPCARDRETADRSDRAGAEHDAGVEPQGCVVVPDVEASPAGGEEKVDVVELVVGDRKRLSDRGDAGLAVAREMLREADEQGDEEPVVLVIADVECRCRVCDRPTRIGVKRE